MSEVEMCAKIAHLEDKCDMLEADVAKLEKLVLEVVDVAEQLTKAVEIISLNQFTFGVKQI